MYKVHQPHVQSGYLTKVAYEATTAYDGQPDWLLHYTPGPKARVEYAAFMRQPGAEASACAPLADADQEDLGAAVTRASSGVIPPSPVASAALGVAPAARNGAVRSAPLPAPTPRTPRPASPEASPPPAAPPADPLQAQAEALVRQFYQRFYGLTQ